MNLAFFYALTSFGDRPNDTPNEKLNHSLLIYLGITMSIGGIIWGSICLSYGLNKHSMIPLGYAFLTILNFLFFALLKSFTLARFVQIFISVLLPFIFQWSLGGFIPSGAVMLWAMISLISMITVQSTLQNIFWLIMYIILTIGSGFIIGNDSMNQYLIKLGLGGVEIPPNLVTLFFVLNISIISLFAVGLNIYFVKRHEMAQIELIESEKTLKAIVEYIGKAIINVNQHGTILFANKEISYLFGYNDKELVGKNINQIVRERRRAQKNPLMLEDERYVHYLLKSAKEHSGRRKNGSVFPIKVELAKIIMENNEKMYVGVINKLKNNKVVE